MRVLITVLTYLAFFLLYYCIGVSILALFGGENWIKLFFDSDVQLGMNISINWWLAGVSTYDLLEEMYQ